MKRLELVPEGWPCKLKECRPGLFVYNEDVCVRDQYNSEPLIAETGEMFWGSTKTVEERDALIVQPVEALWVESDED